MPNVLKKKLKKKFRTSQNAQCRKVEIRNVEMNGLAHQPSVQINLFLFTLRRGQSQLDKSFHSGADILANGVGQDEQKIVVLPSYCFFPPQGNKKKRKKKKEVYFLADSHDY